jgi:hypothetical protein
MRRLCCIAVAVGLSACGGGNKSPVAPTPPPPASIAGGWSGTFESNYRPEAVFMDVTQAGGNVTGTWAMTTGVLASGTLSGSVTSSDFTGLITYSFPRGPVCQGSFSGAAGGNALSWQSPGLTGNCGLSAPGNPTNVRFVMQRR